MRKPIYVGFLIFIEKLFICSVQPLAMVGDDIPTWFTNVLELKLVIHRNSMDVRDEIPT